MDIKQLIRTVQDFPKPGIRFRDITPLLASPEGFRQAIDSFTDRYRGKVDRIAAIEARGFLFGAPLAHAIGVGLVPIRKPGKLPHNSIGHDYDLEYGSSRVEIHVDGVAAGERVVVIDDLLATGGTARAAVALLERVGARVVECAFVIDLVDVGGRQAIERGGHKVHALLAFTDQDP